MERLERMNQYRAAGVSEEDAAVVLGQMSAEDQALIAGLKMYRRALHCLDMNCPQTRPFSTGS